MSVEIVFESEELVAKLEHAEGVTFLHCDVLRTAPSVIKKLRALLKEVQEQREREGDYRPLFSYTKNKRFAVLLGGVYLATFQEHGKTYEVYVWESRQP